MSAEFVAHMEDVLDLYAEPYDPQRPVVCFDETSTQLLAETRPSLPPRPGLPQRQDYEYRREGARNLFLAGEPLAGWRQVEVTERRTMQDFAQQMRWLVDEAYPEVPVVRLVLDNLNTHRTASLYETFPAAEARWIAQSERSALIETSGRGKPLARTVKRALALLKADEGLSDREAAEAVSISAATVARVRRRFAEEGLEAAINDRPRSGRERKLSGRQEAHLVAIACSNAPEGHTNWTLQLLANQVVAMEFAGSISLETVRQILKKTNSNHGRRKSGASPR